MNSAYVKIWGELVGAVAWDDNRGLASFEFDPKFKYIPSLKIGKLKTQA